MTMYYTDVEYWIRGHEYNLSTCEGLNTTLENSRLHGHHQGETDGEQNYCGWQYYDQYYDQYYHQYYDQYYDK